MQGPVAVALITACAGLLGSFLTWVLSRPKQDAERIKLLMDASAELVDRLSTEIERLSSANDELQAANKELRAEVAELRAEVDALRYAQPRS